MELNKQDAIYVTSWAAYNEGRAAGGWFYLDDLAGLTQEEIFDEFRKVGLEPEGQDEELVVHDFDDYTGIGYYEIFGEPYPLTVVDFYVQLKELNEQELLAFIGIRELYSQEEAMELLEIGALNDYIVYSEEAFSMMLQEDIDFGMSIDTLQRYIDREALQRDLEMDIEYDEDGEPSFDVDDYYIDDVIETAPKDFLERYFDFDDYKHDVLMDGAYGEFEVDGEVYYLLQY